MLSSKNPGSATPSAPASKVSSVDEVPGLVDSPVWVMVSALLVYVPNSVGSPVERIDYLPPEKLLELVSSPAKKSHSGCALDFCESPADVADYVAPDVDLDSVLSPV